MNRPNRHGAHAISVCLTLTTLLVATPLAAQDYFDIVDVPLIDVDVVVSDRRNRPVADLEIDDFALKVDGEEHEITFFSPPSPSATDRAESTSSAYLAILFDNNGIEAAERNAVIEDLRQFLQEDQTSDLQIMVTTAGLSDLEVLQELTSDRDSVDAALAAVTETATRDRHVADYESLMLEIQRLSGVRDPTLRQLRTRAMTLVGQIQAFSDQARQEAEISGGHLWQLVEALAGLPGRKAILFVGGAMSISPGEALFSALREALTRTADAGAHQVAADLPAGISTGGSDAVRALTQAASVHQVSLYSIVVGGASRMAPGGGSAASLSTGDSSATDRSDSWAPSSGFQNRLEVETALSMLADGTGGLVHRSGRNLPAALERLDRALAGSYSLAFHPPEGSDGAIHRIAVVVRGKNFQVRHRRTFQVRNWDQEAAMRVRSGLHLGVLDNPLDVGMEVRPATPAGEGTVRIPVTVELPLSSIALEPVEEAHRGQLSVFMAPGSSRFRAEPVRKSVLPIVLPNEELQGAMGQMAEYRLDLEAPEGSTSVAVGVRDDLGSAMSVLQVDLPIEESVLTSPGGEPSASRDRATDNEARLNLPTAALLLSRQNGGPIHLEVEAGLESASEGRWSVPIEIGIGSDGLSATGALELFALAVTVEGRVTAKASQVVDRSPQDSIAGSGGDVTVRVPLEVPAGRYTIRVAVRDRSSSDFGVVGLDVEVPGPGVGRARWSTRDNEPGPVDWPGPAAVAEVPDSDGGRSRQVIMEGYGKAIEALASGNADAARRAVISMETSAVDSQDRQTLLGLAKAESRVLLDLADGDWDRLLPIAVIYGQLIAEYRRLHQEPLSEHAMLVSTGLAERMARKSRGDREASEISDLLVSLSGYLLYLQRLAKTQHLLELAIKENPRNSLALLAMVAALEQRGDYLAAIETLDKLLEIDPDYAEGHLRKGVNLARTKRSDEAIQSFRAVMDLDSAEWIQQVAAHEMARALVSEGRTQEAIEILDHASRRWPEQPSLGIQLAWILDNEERREEAAGWLERLAVGGEKATDSARYRYLQWYEEGLESMRRDLLEIASRRAAELGRQIEREVEDGAAR